MQEMNSQETSERSFRASEGYAGEPSYHEWDQPVAGQKLVLDDEIAASYSTGQKTRKAGSVSSGQRLILAIVSICVLAILFCAVVLAFIFGHLSSDGMAALGAGMFGLLVAVVLINVYFNWENIKRSKR